MPDCKQENFLGRLIYFTAQDMSNFAEKMLKPYEITLEQFHILKNMDMTKGYSQRELGGIANKTPANLTRILDRMEAKSLVVRRGDPADRRKSLVYLTEKGTALIDEVIGEFNLYSSRILSGIDEVEQQVARDVLTRMAANVRSLAEKLTGNIKE